MAKPVISSHARSNLRDVLCKCGLPLRSAAMEKNFPKDCRLCKERVSAACNIFRCIDLGHGVVCQVCIRDYIEETYGSRLNCICGLNLIRSSKSTAKSVSLCCCCFYYLTFADSYLVCPQPSDRCSVEVGISVYQKQYKLNYSLCLDCAAHSSVSRFFMCGC